MKALLTCFVITIMLGHPIGTPGSSDWILSGSVMTSHTGKQRLMTRWAQNVSPENVHPEYPRPQMVRLEWMNLKGLWKHTIQPRNDDRPEQFDGSILVPFPIESALSGVGKQVGSTVTSGCERSRWTETNMVFFAFFLKGVALLSCSCQAPSSNFGTKPILICSLTDLVRPMTCARPKYKGKPPRDVIPLSF